MSEDQQTRPTSSDAPDNGDADALREIHFAETDVALRRDVGRLGALVGEVLAEQRGDAFFQRVEALRRAAIARREGGAPMADIAALISNLSQDEAAALVRAFAAYFGAVNLAERVHRIRRRRDYQKAGADAQPGGLLAVLSRLKSDGVTADELRDCLAGLRVEPVFTAHPTEALRRALLEKEQLIVECLVADIDGDRTPQERRVDRERMRMALTAAWQTAESPPTRPTVADEMEHVGFYLSDVLYRVLPVFHEVFDDALGDSFGDIGELPPMIAFGSWVGGDMDGNPNVGANTIRAALGYQRAQVIANYGRELAHLAQLLSQSTSRIDVSEALQARIREYANLLPDAVESDNPRIQEMPYRHILALMRARLRATLEGNAAAYSDARSFRADVDLIGDSLQQNRGLHAGGFAVRRLQRRVACFGFHLATLDMRQDSRIHDLTIAEQLGDADWPERDAGERAGRLRDLLDVAPQQPNPGEQSDRALAVFREVAEARQRYGSEALGPYIVSMSRSAGDALAVLYLARLAGLADRHDRVLLDVAPLFETVDDLNGAADVLVSLFDDPHYRRHLQARGDRQVVMLGYSDSAKDGGLMASRWALQQTQIALTTLAHERGIRIAFFHGRGGSISRGGGKTERAVIAAPRGSVDGYLRLTEQGEVIHRKYGIRAIALRNLEQATGAVLRATLRPRPPEPREVQWREAMTAMAGISRDSFRALIHEHPDFVRYFREATPIDVIERLNISSRPPKRAAGEQAGISSLRAIPWVFSWSQNRAGLTAWYGVGTALTQGIEQFGEEMLSTMAGEWPFFAALVDDVEMTLAKSDLDVFERYSELAGDLHPVMFPMIRDEFLRCRDAILRIKGEDSLLAKDYRLALSIRLRNPYVDPISLLQVDLLRRWREGGREDASLFEALAATVNGISAGVQNTG
ncbi:MAG: phosphoenolpyruvate carboxylase [Xanthomonadales bacterium]|nr:phosphoenolpyruvate carboxylase [Xanthomonadales bacterium]